MIHIELTHAAVLYMALLMFITLGIWVYTELSVRRGQRFLEKQYHWRCIFCGFSYLDESGEPVSRCPRCDSYNSVEDHLAKEVRPMPAWQEEEPNPLETRKNTSHRKRPHQRRRGPRRH